MNLLLFGISLTALVYRAHTGRQLTPAGIAAAIATACAHGLHSWNLPFVLLFTFYLLGTTATRTKHDVKSRLTVSSSGSGGGEGARTMTQVFANSLVASVLTVLYALRMRSRGHDTCYDGDVLLIGIIGNYAAVTADTLSSELGILSRSGPRLITTLRRCPPGTNGGVSVTGLLAGAAGAAAIGTMAALLMPPRCGVDGHGPSYSSPLRSLQFVAFVTVIGVFGSVLDSLLGAVLQQSVVDVHTGKVVEAPGGGTVLVEPSSRVLSPAAELRSRFSSAPQTGGQAVGYVGGGGPATKAAEGEPSRRVFSGRAVLSNNGVNFAMAAATSAVAMAAWTLMGW